MNKRKTWKWPFRSKLLIVYSSRPLGLPNAKKRSDLVPGLTVLWANHTEIFRILDQHIHLLPKPKL